MLYLLYSRSNSALEKEIHLFADRDGIMLVDSDSLDDPAPRFFPHFSPRRGRYFILKSLFATLLMKKPYRAISLFKTFSSRKAGFEFFFMQNGIRVLLCSEDGISGDLAAISAAKERGILVVDIPYGCGTSYEILFDMQKKAEQGRLITAFGRDLRALQLVTPQWLGHTPLQNAIMLPPEYILAVNLAGAVVRDPWIIHGGDSDLLCVENERSLEQYRKENIPEDKLSLTGSPYCDRMFAALSNLKDAAAALRKPRKIQADLTKILISWPPSYHETYPERNEFATYDEMTKNVFRFLCSLPNVELTTSLHPACTDETRHFLCSLGVQLTEEYIIDLLPQHDIFCTYFSSTIRWALASGKIVVNYDAYGLGISTFNEAPGFLNTALFAEFTEVLHRLTVSDASFTSLASRQIEVADQWGIIDGRCNERILREITGLIEQKEKRGRA